jgi:hypothetical protein
MLCSRRFPSSPPLQVVVDEVAAVIELVREKVFKDAAPQDRGMMISDKVEQFLERHIGVGARRCDVPFEHLVKHASPLIPEQKFP